MRTFIAIEFEDSTKSEISALQEKIKAECRRGNFTVAENLHLTMHFLGEILPDEIDGVAEAMAETAYANRKFKLKFDRLGYFDRGEKCILWLGVEKSRELLRLYNTLEKNLAKQGFGKERGGFTPHITLVREVLFFYNRKVAMEKFKTEFNEMVVKEISLMESKRINGRLVYRRIYATELK
ncbi:RNA 2',3'-cyclic phosphodiesterase [Clostridiales bacterium]|nr:RNA 2',3'-cyclic phosphodiesterase [Clostridiales bacterium]